MNRNYIIHLLTIFCLYFVGTGYISGQETGDENMITVSSVIHGDDGSVLPDAKIIGKEGAVVVWSDVDGKFTISVPAETNLLIEKKGYFQQLIPVAEIPSAVTMTKAPFLMSDDDAVNIAFGNIKKKEAAGIIDDVINPEEILTINGINDWNAALEGRYFDRMMRNPLIIIDGFPRMPIGLLAEEIEQITVLKGVNAAVLYGTQARDGVVLIKTKRGEAHKRRINFSLERGFDQSVVLPKYLGSAQYMELYNEALANDGESPLYETEMIDNYRTGNRYRYPDVDYYSSEFLRESRPVTRFNGEFSGGNDHTRYYTNLGVINTGSIYNLGTGRDVSTNELNMRANADLKINSFIDGHFDASANFVFDKEPNGNFWNAAATYHPYYYSPIIPVSMLSEDLALSLQEAGTKYIDDKYILGGTSQYQDNVYGNMYMAGYNQHVGRLLTVTSGLDFDLGSIVDGLTFKTLFGADMYNIFAQSVNNTYAVYDPTWETVGGVEQVTALTKIGLDRSPGVQNVSNPYFYRQITAQAIMDYKRTFQEEHSLNITALGYYTKLRRDFFTIDDKATHLGLRVAYDFNKKLFADFSSAYVHSIRLKKGNRDAFSPTIGLGWVLSDEDFLAEAGAIDYLKLKFSAGILNTDYTEDTYSRFTGMLTDGYDMMYKRYQSNILGSTYFNWADGLHNNNSRLISGVDNPDLTFEKVKNINLGIEGYFFNKSLAIDANAFYIKNSGIIVQMTDTYSSLLSSYIPYKNYEANSHTGAEVGINWMETMGDFSFNIGGNLIYRTSNADKRDEIYPNDFQYRAGHPVTSIFGLESDGFFDDENEIAVSPVQTAFGVVVPGDIKYKDQDNDEYITENDVVYLGNSLAPLAYGLNLTLKYKNFSLYTLCDGQNGGNSMTTSSYYWVDGNDKYSENVLNRWTESTKTTATFPRLTAKSNNNNFRISDFWLYETNYFRINRVQLTYEFPRSAFGLKGFSLYLRGSNLLWVGKEVDKMQLRTGGQPSYRQYAAGLRISF